MMGETQQADELYYAQVRTVQRESQKPANLVLNLHGLSHPVTSASQGMVLPSSLNKPKLTPIPLVQNQG